MVRTVLFDFDGTLAQYTGDFPSLFTPLLNALEVPIPRHREVGEAYGRRLMEHRHVDTYLALERTYLELGLSMPTGARPITEDFCRRYAAEVHPLPGMVEVVDTLRRRGLRVGIVTNGPADMQAAAIANAGFADRVNAVTISGHIDTAVWKPNPRIFELALERLGGQAETAAMVGDSHASDLRGAIAAGIRPIAVPGVADWHGESFTDPDDLLHRLSP